MPTVRVSIERIQFTPLAALRGSGRFRVEATIAGMPVGEPGRVFVGGITTPEFLDSSWTTQVVANGLAELAIVFRVIDALGLAPPTEWSETIPAPFVDIHSDTRGAPWFTWTFSVGTPGSWAVPDRIDACRIDQGAAVCTSAVVGVRRELRLEICPVRPTPSDAWLPPRPSFCLMPGIPEFRNAGRTTPFLGAPINVLGNPPVIPLMTRDEATEDTASSLQVSYYAPSTFNFDYRDPRLEWRVVSGPGDVDFVGGNTGLAVYCFGTHEGEVTLEVRYRDVCLSTYRALVLARRRLPVRVNVLIGPDERSRPNYDASRTRELIELTNMYLRQVNIELVLDRDTRTMDGARAVPGVDGTYVVDAAKAHTRRVRTEEPTARDMRKNARAHAMNVYVIQSFDGGEYSGLMLSNVTPPSATVVDHGTPSTSWIRPSGVPPDAASQPLEMRLVDTWVGDGVTAVALATKHNGGTATLADLASTLAHEIGHALGLEHRIPDGQCDGLVMAPTENLMRPIASDAGFYLDILQAKALHESVLLQANRGL